MNHSTAYRISLAAALLAVFGIVVGASCESENRTAAKHGNDTGPVDNSDGSSPDSDHGDSGLDTGLGDSSGDSQPDSGGNTDKDDTEICASQAFEISFVPTRLMILQDMSSSMKEGSPSKWEQTRTAIQSMLANPANASIEFGFDKFPSGSSNCSADASVLADCAPDNAATISAMLDSMTPGSAALTPLCPAMRNFDESVSPSYTPACMADGASRYLLIVSDGEANCGNETIQCGKASTWGSSTPPTPAELAAKTADILQNSGMKTFVIGYGDDVEENQLNAIAKAGGTTRDTYINVTNQNELQEALDGIAATVVSCTFDINDPSATADPENVNFKFDGEIVPRDDGCAQNQGWNWVDANQTQVEFCKEACDELQSGSVKKVSAEFGCPTEVVVPI